MKWYKHIVFILVVTVAAWSAVSLEIQNVDTGAGTLDIYMINDEPIGGFQFELLGINITGASTPDGFFVSTSSTTILAFSLTGATIPAGEGILTQVSFSDFEGESICFGEDTGSSGDTAISDGSGNYIAANWGDCFQGDDCEYDECGVCNGPGAIFECGCNGLPDGECDCAGNVADCAGVCGGNAEQDQCGVCNGDGSSCNSSTVSLELQNVNLDS